VKVGWEIKQKWELASDISPPDTYTDDGSAYKPSNLASDFTDVRYKYTWKLIPYSVISFNVRPNAKLDRIFQLETQLNVDQFKSSFYLAFVYY